MQERTIAEGTVQQLTVDALCRAVQHTFLIMTGLEVALGAVWSQEDAAPQSTRVVSLIGWAGYWSGAGVLECTPEFASMIANLVLGTESDELDEDALACVGEMANIIFGNMKTAMETTLGDMGLGTPTVSFDRNPELYIPKRNFSVIPICIAGHDIWLKVFMGCEKDLLNPMCGPPLAGAF